MYTYTYNSANRPITITQGVNTYTFAYNGLGDRMRQVVNGITTTYTLDLNAGLTQVLADGTNTYLYGTGRIAQQNITSTDYFLGDALGSVRQLANASGALTLAKSYQPYGSVMSSVGTATSTYGFTGEATDNTGLVYLRARYYGPQWGRFITRDTWPGDNQRPISFNAWLYAYANPVNLTDPTGFRARDKWDDYRLEILRFGIDIASDEDDGIGSMYYGVAKRAIGYVVHNFLGGSLVRDVQCYLNPNLESGQDNNSFDYLFSGWVDYWKWRGRRAGQPVPNSLTPSLIKALSFRESRIGNTATGFDSNIMQVDLGTAESLAGYSNIRAVCGQDWANCRPDKGSRYGVRWGYIRIFDQIELSKGKYRDDLEKQVTPAQSIGAGVRWVIYHTTHPWAGSDINFGEFANDPKAVFWIRVFRSYGPHTPDTLSYGPQIWRLYKTGSLYLSGRERVFTPIPPP